MTELEIEELKLDLASSQNALLKIVMALAPLTRFDPEYPEYVAEEVVERTEARIRALEEEIASLKERMLDDSN